MQNKRKTIIFVIIVLISIGGLVFKGYFSNDIYVLNEEENISSNQNSTMAEGNEEGNLEDNDSSESTENAKLENNQATDKNVGVKEITVYVTGAVNNEGIVTLDSDKRLADAIKKLGGLTQKADTKNINLAMKLEDETHYIIPKKGEKIETNIITNNKDTSNNETTINGVNANSNSNQSDKININTASIGELDEIPGVGEATANKILSYREENGSFKSIEEIKKVNGIGEKKFENMKDLICIK